MVSPIPHPNLRNQSLSHIRSLWFFCPLWTVLLFVFYCETRNSTDKVQTKKEHKYKSRNVDSLLKTLRRVQKFFIVKNFEWLLTVYSKHEELVSKFLLNWLSRSDKNLYIENTVKKKSCKQIQNTFDLALDFCTILNDFSYICFNQWIITNWQYTKLLHIFSGIGSICVILSWS